MKIKGIIFDLDGTLLDTLCDLAESMNTVLANHGFAVHPIDVYRYFVGDGMDTLVERTVPAENRDRLTLAACLDEMKTLYASRCDLKTAPYKGVREVLSELRCRGIMLAVLTNKVQAIALTTVKRFLGETDFSQIVGASEKFRKKPDPQGALYIAEKWNIKSSEILYVGDTMVDMRTAKSAQMHAAGVLWGFRDEKELLDNGAEFILKEPSEILTLLDVLEKSN